jgi:hypothetical protein
MILQIDMSNIIDQAQKIIEANGFSDSEHALNIQMIPTTMLISSLSHHSHQGKDGGS